MQVLWIGMGGFIGANMRYWLGSGIGRWLGTGYPWATGLVNLTGAFLIGIIATIFANKVVDNESLRLFLIVGILGGYTTFSSYTYEGMMLVEEGRLVAAFGYLIGSVMLGIVACGLGILVGRAIAT